MTEQNIKPTTLRSWQKEISKDEYRKSLETRPFLVGYNKYLDKYYLTDTKNPDYKAFQSAKAKKKLAKRNEIVTPLREAVKKLTRENKVLKKKIEKMKDPKYAIMLQKKELMAKYKALK